MCYIVVQCRRRSLERKGNGGDEERRCEVSICEAEREDAL